MEAEPASETLFLKKKNWTMDKVQKKDSSKCSAVFCLIFPVFILFLVYLTTLYQLTI
jgi:hypothetical protein